MKKVSNCEHCVNYVYDDEYCSYVCTVDLDEDEYARYLQRSYDNCPYFKLDDEYGTARKQM
ncbi:MAG TPA: DUF6472 family protein [Clostridiales bacterium]|nr:DUF6472 family protein [Clostridiales bacterium]HOL91174.1 DUF6472 family protein [Clostridiales bacterium]HPP34926.1 DUF6472 family protein [Clostridiales bacterium]